MEFDERLPTGEWKGFYLESHQPQKGWMHLYMSFEDGKVKGEGTDYVGPWTATGSYDTETGICSWVKQYVRKHMVSYKGICGPNGIQGEWDISNYSNGQFHIWPASMGNMDELYLREELSEPAPHMHLGTVPVEDFASIA